ncbi:MmpS family transport accessory protein [Streptomyces sp. NPDC008163]|uniref:MmpS family transport accessory protein n=1 Tax=Streptomyces sp. NPDC008163 TaxID=3364818 RepID=UPI0036E26324
MPDPEKPMAAEPAADEPTAAESSSPKTERVDRRGIAAAAALFAACAGLVVYGVLDTNETPERHVPTASVTYEVTGDGTADLTYQARDESGKAVTVRGAELPWRKTVRVPLGKPPVVTVALDAKGGRASCQLAVRGVHVQTATAYGTYGRATCQGELPSPEPTESAAESAE